MHPKIKNRPAAGKNQAPVTTVKPLLLHEVTNPSASAAAASRRRLPVGKTVPTLANHARHHVSRLAQS
jgi:hypothetical protein